MAAGHAEREARRVGAPVHIVDRTGAPRWHELWEGNPHIARPGERVGGKVANGSGCRPYIAYPFTREKGHGYTDWRARDHRGRLYLTDDERRAGRRLAELGDPFVIIEPNPKLMSNPNKAWPARNWVELVALLDGVRLIQIGPADSKRLRGAEFVPTASFRQGAGVLASAACLVAYEGGLHHAAAALDVPAVVIFGGSCSVEATGYPDHINFGGSDPCGKWSPCEHCAATMRGITPELVASAVRQVINLEG